MPQASTRAFVLAQKKLGEQDKTVTLLSQKRGIMRAVAPGACRSKNRFGSSLELFSKADFFYYWKEDKPLVTLTKADFLEGHFFRISLPQNIFYFSVMSEVLQKTMALNQKEQRTFNLTDSVLSALETGTPPDLLLAYFLVWFVRIQGLMFHPATCSICSRTPLEESWVKQNFRGVVCDRCHSTEKILLKKPEIDFLLWIKSNAPQNTGAWQQKNVSAAIIRTFCQKIQYHGEVQLLSTRCLSEFS